VDDSTKNTMQKLTETDLTKLSDMTGNMLSLLKQLKDSEHQIAVLEELLDAADKLQDRIDCLLEDLSP
jgi:hypothetical protein